MTFFDDFDKGGKDNQTLCDSKKTGPPEIHKTLYCLERQKINRTCSYMGIYYEKRDLPGASLAIWKTEETTADLCNLLGIPASQLPSQTGSRQREWLAIRVLLRRLYGQKPAPEIGYDEHGKPFLSDSITFISISHTKEYVGVLLSASHRCGLDIELIHPRIEKIASRFLSDEERQFIPAQSLPYLFVIWSAKEVLYKIYGKGGILFRDHLRVDPFQMEASGQLCAHIMKEGVNHEYSLHYLWSDKLLIAYAFE
jgi:4'-phosphopantetheinyl transferase